MARYRNLLGVLTKNAIVTRDAKPVAIMTPAAMRLPRVPGRLKGNLAEMELPNHHKDPFDRLLVCQAFYERATSVSRASL